MRVITTFRVWDRISTSNTWTITTTTTTTITTTPTNKWTIIFNLMPVVCSHKGTGFPCVMVKIGYNDHVYNRIKNITNEFSPTFFILNERFTAYISTVITAIRLQGTFFLRSQRVFSTHTLHYLMILHFMRPITWKILRYDYKSS